MPRTGHWHRAAISAAVDGSLPMAVNTRSSIRSSSSVIDVWISARRASDAGFGAAAVALLLLIFPRTRGLRPKLLVAALLLGLMAGAPLIALLMQAKQLPYIHDVTTDTRDPPAFVALEAARRASANGLAYGGAEVAAAQQNGYPHIR